MPPRLFLLAIAAQFVFSPAQGRAEEPVAVEFSRQQLEEKWRARVQSFLDKGVLPLIDLESSLKRQDGERYLAGGLKAMDDLGVALIAFDGYQAKTESAPNESYRWGYYVHQVVNAYPGRFILATNGGTNPNWLKGRESFVGQTEAHVLGGAYPIMGEFDFRHYMSNSQCRKGKTERDTDLPLDGKNGHRIFQLSAETGVAFAIHLEPEDHALDALEGMLKTYPKARVIVAHFGQIRFPEREKRFGPNLVRRLLGTYKNLYYDLSTGSPGRRYPCNANVLDTVIWQDDFAGSQKGVLKPRYKAVLSEFPDRFVVGTDYGGGRSPWPKFLAKKVKNIRLILKALPEQARHAIAYGNAWRLLTGKPWK